MKRRKRWHEILADEERAVMRAEAERRVIAVRGSWDVPGFAACVEAELANMEAAKELSE
jgi:hypothetical protein